MIYNILDSLPILKDFDELKAGDRVYSKQYGIGTIHSFYSDDEAIVFFPGCRKRLSIHDEISKIPASYLQGSKSAPIEVYYAGQIISFAEFKRRNKIEKRRIALKKLLGE